MSYKRILITGGAGFIASHLTDTLIDKKYTVFVVDDLSGGFKENINPKSNFTKLDLTNTKKTEQYIKKIKPDLIFHLAADATEGRSQFTPLSATKRNYLIYLNTIVPAINHGLKKVVVVSSMSVYGEQKPPFSEDMATSPVDIYGIAKEAMEKATKVLSQVHKFNYCIIRLHNVYGPRQNMTDPYRNVIGIFINRLLENKNFFIYGDGLQKRSFTYIDDCIPYLAKAGLENFDRDIFNIGPTEVATINKLSEIILKHFVIDSKHLPKSLKPIYVKSRPLEVKDAYCTNEKAKKLLGLTQTVPLEEGIKRTVSWAKKRGHQPFVYLKEFEISSKYIPATWTKKLI